MTATKHCQGSPSAGSDCAASLLWERCYVSTHSLVGALSGHISCNIFASFLFLFSESWVEKGLCLIFL